MGYGHGHSHDSADRVDHALETSRRGLRTLGWSFAALLVTAVAQLVLVLVTGSVALLGDTIHNFPAALTPVPPGIPFVLGGRGAARPPPYGPGPAGGPAGRGGGPVVAGSAGVLGVRAGLGRP